MKIRDWIENLKQRIRNCFNFLNDLDDFTDVSKKYF